MIPFPPPPRPVPQMALALLSTRQQSELTGDARQMLSMTPIQYDMSYPRSGTVRGGTIVIGSNPLRRPVSTIVLHEGLHLWDQQKHLSDTLGTSEARRSMYSRYFQESPRRVPLSQITSGNYADARNRYSVEGLPTQEAFATLGMNGPEGVPPNMLSLFDLFFTPQAIQQARWAYSHGR